MKRKIEFTDRYGGNPPSWLRGCFGECEATGIYPEPKTRGKDGTIPIGTEWEFITCKRCNGSGRCSWFETVARIPKWIVRGIRFTIHGPSMGKIDTWKDKAIRFKCAFLSDLGMWKP